MYMRRKKQAQVVPTPNILRKSRYDTTFDDGDGDGEDPYTQPLDKGKSPEGMGQTGIRLGRAPRRSRPLMVLTDLRASRSSMLSTPLFNRNSEVSSVGLLGTLSAAGSLSAEVDARSVKRRSSGSYLRTGGEWSGHRHEDDVPALPSSSEEHARSNTGVQSLESGTPSSFAGRRGGALWQTQIATLRQEMTQEIARLREQTEAITMVPPPAYV